MRNELGQYLVTRPIIGIDPGLSGAIAYLDLNHQFLFDMPVVEKSGTGKIRHEVDAKALSIMLEKLLGNDSATIVVERVSTMPGRPGKPGEAHNRFAPQQSGAGAFSLGDSVGCIRGVIGALGYDVKWVTPTRWKHYWQLTGRADQKELARFKAQQLYPELEPGLCRKKDHNRAEALLIARWAWDQEIHR